MHPRIYIGRLNGQVKKNQVNNLFGKFGEIKDILMKEDFAFIEFDKSESAQEAIKKMNGYQIEGTQIRLVVEEARPKSPEERKDYPKSRITLQNTPKTAQKALQKNSIFFSYFNFFEQ